MKSSRDLAALALVVVACVALQGCPPTPNLLMCGRPPDDPATFYNIPIGDQQELGNPCNGGSMFFPRQCFTLNPPADPPDGFSLFSSIKGDCESDTDFPSFKLRVNAPAMPGQTYFVQYMFSAADEGIGFGALQVFVSEKRLAVAISAAPSPVTLGSNLTYTITVMNNGPADATDVTMSDPLPGTVTLVSATSSQGTCSGTSTVSCKLGTLTDGSSATVDIVVTPTQVGTITNTASAQANESDPNTANNAEPLTTTVLAARALADLAVAISAPPSVTFGNNLTYTITVTNNGPADAPDIALRSDLLPNVALVSIPPGCVGALGGTIMCGPLSLASGTSVPLTIVVRAFATPTITNTVTVTSPTTQDPDPTNNTRSVITAVSSAR